MAANLNAYQQAIADLATNAERSIGNTYATMADQGLSAADLRDVLSPLIQSANLEAKSLTNGELARMIAEIAGGSPADYLVDAVQSDSIDAIQGAVTRATEEPELAEQRIRRLARGQPTEAAQVQMIESMQRSGEVIGYTRVLEGDACELCHWLDRGGDVQPVDRPLTTHPGCLCTAKPVIKGVTP